MKKHYDFIEIGTSDFDTIIESTDDNKIGLTIEPLRFYLDRLPNKKNVKKLQIAISDTDGEIEIYHIPEENIIKHSLPWWVRGSNSVGKPHPFTVKEIGKELYDSIVQIDKVPTVSWNTLVEKENIGSITYLKVDTEGFDHVIINDYLEMCELNNELYADVIQFERHPEVSNIEKIDEIIKRFKNYYSEIQGTDVILTKVKIPRIIHQTFRVNEFPEEIQNCVDKVKSMNPEFEYRFYNDDDCSKFVRENYDEETFFLYESINPKYGSAKADFFRYLLMYKVGGVYLDLKSTTSAPLKDTILPTDEYLLTHWEGRDWNELLNYYHGEFQNWHVVCIPGHPFLKKTIEMVKENIKNYRGQKGKRYVLQITGPIVYSQAILSMLDEYRLYSDNSPVREFRLEHEVNLVYRNTREHQSKLYGSNVAENEPIILNQKNEEGLFYKGQKIADKGYLLNLPHRSDRLNQTIKLLDELGFSGYEVFEGIIIDNPEYKKLGCTASYLKMFEQILSSTHNDVIVFEDDIKLMNKITLSDLDKIFGDWNDIKEKYDVVALGTKLLPRSKITLEGSTHGSFEEMLCTQSLYYKKEIIKHVYDQLSGFLNENHYLHKCTIDMFLNDCSSGRYRFVHSHNHKKFEFGITIPMIFSQTNSFSDNEGQTQDYENEMEKSFYNALKHEKGYVLFATENYIHIITECSKSIREFSSLPIFVYIINSNKKIDVENTTTINWICDIENVSDKLYIKNNDNFYIDRRNPTIYKILIQKPLVVKHVLSNYLKNVCFVDSDSVATPNVDRIFSYYDESSKHPYFVQGVYDYLRLYGRGGGGNFGGGLTETLEYPACELFNVDQSVRLRYRQTGYFICGQNTYDFLDEWYWMCIHPKVVTNCEIYAPFNEETISNVLLWKHNHQEGLPYIYVNGGLDTIEKMYTEVTFKGPNEIQYLGDWLRAPQDKEHIMFFHGEKNPEKMNAMVKKIKYHNTKKGMNILFLAPHLSTGGMPGFLLKKIQLLKKYCPDITLYVVEYQSYGDAYVVQRNQIKEIIDSNKFWTLGENKFELIEILKNNNIDIVHVEEMIEGFDSFNQVPAELMSKLYSSDRTWRMVETCHNVWFNPNEDKVFYPEAFAFCTPYHKEITFKDVPSYSEVLEFPIEKVEISEQERIDIRKELGFGKDKLHVINVGLWTKGKNQGEGVEIAKLLKKSNPEIMFHFIGNQAPNFKDYWSPIMKSIPMNVKVWGERADIDKFMKAADVFMFNSTWECNPLVLREAISHGLKVLSRNLTQYMTMFSPYIESIDDNIETTKEKLLKLLQEKRKYEPPIGQEKQFAISHSEFYKKVVEIPIKEQKFKTKLSVSQHFINQPFIEIKGRSENKFRIQFFDESNKLHYDEVLNINSWIRLNRQYYTKWTTKIWENKNLVYEYTLDYESKRVLISLDSKSLGDSVSWIPYVLEFQNKHKCKVIVSTFWNHLFEPVYPELEFVLPGAVVGNIHGMYKVGWFNNIDMQPRVPKTIPLQKTATDILGLDFTEIKPRIYYEIKSRPYEEKYITIATNSTAGCKFWTREGWQELINYLTSIGYRIVNVSKENNPFDNQIRLIDTSIENTMNVIHHSEFFIGLSSGLSWLAWGIGKHVVMISNFTNPDHEFQTNCTRIVNLSVCNGCWNKLDYEFDKGDWDWCPVHKGTDRQFECHKSISAQMLIQEIKHII